ENAHSPGKVGPVLAIDGSGRLRSRLLFARYSEMRAGSGNPQRRIRFGNALADFEADGVGFHRRLSRQYTNHFVLTGWNDVEIVVAMVPGNFKDPILAAPNSLLPDDLTEKHPAGPAPHFLPCRCIQHLKVVGLARFESARQ